MTEHPLTEEGGSDDQLKQVIEWIEDEGFYDHITDEGFYDHITYDPDYGVQTHVSDFIANLKKAMRPTTTRGQQLMTEAQWALFTVLDGYQRHDLYDIMAGLDEEEVSRVWAAYQEACNLYNKNENNS
jgi:hypothetical protein